MSRRYADYYPTPPCAGMALRRWLAEYCPRELEMDDWLDPAAGPGLLLEYVVPMRRQRRAIELQEEFIKELLSRVEVPRWTNALSAPWDGAEHIVMNPPFALATEFIKRGLEHIAETGGLLCALLRTGWLQAAARLEVPLPSHLLLLTWRPSFDGSGQTDTFSYAWMVWDATNRSQLHLLDRLERPPVPAELAETHQRLATIGASVKPPQGVLL